MSRVSLRVLFLSLFLVLQATNSEEDGVKQSLINFISEISFANSNAEPASVFGWNMTTDPCLPSPWIGIQCDTKNNYVRKVILDGLSLFGTIDTSSLCALPFLSVLSFQNNSFSGVIGEDIGNCKQMTHLLLSGNRFSGVVPDSVTLLNNLKKLEIANNNFSGKLPNLAGITGLVSFVAENNQFTGEIPSFDFSNLVLFNVSSNNFSGPVPDLRRFGLDSISGNPGLCGGPTPNACPSPSVTQSPSNGARNLRATTVWRPIGVCIIFIYLELCRHSFLIV